MENVMLKNINTTEKKPSILYQGNRKDAFRASQEMIRPTHFEETPLKDFDLTKAQGTFLIQSHLMKCFYKLNYPNLQRPLLPCPKVSGYCLS